ncbi:MAG TPA: flagellar basal body rod protein FlgC [Alphaproteobacteria bacterium]|nr:flagellar basal body rod protein FlgC [Alphaproteobacteria bacterium]
MTDMYDAMTISAYGMRAQGERTRVISENIANAETTGLTPDEEPYSRKVITFKNEMDRQHGEKLVKVEDITDDRRDEFPLKYMPDHPAADADGYVKMPNVNILIELNDMREAQRSYEANLGMIENSRTMMFRTIDLLR